MTTPPSAQPRHPWWPWLVLALGLAWTVLIRIPLVLNAEDHLDSDLAVDGLTLLDAVNGRWRWHYPGTPHMGILPMLASFPQALAWGANPITLVSGGTVLWGLVVVSAFWLAWRAYGPSVACWAIVPLVFSSLGTIWLSGRITGGHLLTLTWHALAFVGLQICLKRGGWRSAAMLGAWCGLGLYIDAMVLFTIAGLGAAALLARPPISRSRILLGAAFLGGIALGVLPREIGRRVDSYDAYPSQFAPTFESSAIARHAEILVRECLPRLIAGVRWEAVSRSPGPFGSSGWPTAGGWLLLLVMAGFAAAMLRLAVEAVRPREPDRGVTARGTLTSGLLIVAAFLINRNIYNSDNYRYLIFLLIPWSLGFGLGLDDLYRLGKRGQVAGVVIAGLLAAGMTFAAFRWYRETRHYLDDRGYPVRLESGPWWELIIRHDRPHHGDPQSSNGRAIRYAITPDVTHVFGGYWDVYRLAFLSGGQVVGVPHPMYPNRFPGWSAGLGPGRGKIMIFRPGEESASTRPAAEMPGGRPDPVRSARAINWHPALGTAWRLEGRDLAELDRLAVVVP